MRIRMLQARIVFAHTLLADSNLQPIVPIVFHSDGRATESNRWKLFHVTAFRTTSFRI
jgi:hypothetical protein